MGLTAGPPEPPGLLRGLAHVNIGHGLLSPSAEDDDVSILGPVNQPAPAPQRIPDSAGFPEAVKPSDTQTANAYPTASKEAARDRRNELKAQGIDPKTLVKKRPKIIEDHYDDCGDNLSSISTDLYAESLNEWSSDPSDGDLSDLGSEASASDLEGEDDGAGLSLFAFYGCDHAPHLTMPLQCFEASTLEDAFAVLKRTGKGLDICELCGGAARTSRLAVRRKLKAGRNFDLVTDCDLNEPRQQKLVLAYIDERDVIVVVTAPTCTPFGSLSHLNKGH